MGVNYLQLSRSTSVFGIETPLQSVVLRSSFGQGDGDRIEE
jgi:hypothetical protein